MQDDGAALTDVRALCQQRQRKSEHVGTGGGNLSIGGMLTNSVSVSVGNSQLTSSDTINVDALDNTGTINLTGNSSGNTRQAVLSISLAWPCKFNRTAVLSGQAMLELSGSGEITSIARALGLSSPPRMATSPVTADGKQFGADKYPCQRGRFRAARRRGAEPLGGFHQLRHGRYRCRDLLRAQSIGRQLASH